MKINSILNFLLPELQHATDVAYEMSMLWTSIDEINKQLDSNTTRLVVYKSRELKMAKMYSDYISLDV